MSRMSQQQKRHRRFQVGLGWLLQAFPLQAATSEWQKPRCCSLQSVDCAMTCAISASFSRSRLSYVAPQWWPFGVLQTLRLSRRVSKLSLEGMWA